MSPGIDDVIPPQGEKNIVLQVIEYVEAHWPVADQTKFSSYDEACHALWPGLFKSDSGAALKVAVAVFLDAAERKGFKVEPEQLKELKF